MTNVPYEDVDNADYTLSAETDENIAIYDYNCYNQLVGVDTNGIKSIYSYSPDGLRLSKTVDGDTITFVYDNSNVVEEISNGSTNKKDTKKCTSPNGTPKWYPNGIKWYPNGTLENLSIFGSYK